MNLSLLWLSDSAPRAASAVKKSLFKNQLENWEFRCVNELKSVSIGIMPLSLLWLSNSVSSAASAAKKSLFNNQLDNWEIRIVNELKSVSIRIMPLSLLELSDSLPLCPLRPLRLKRVYSTINLRIENWEWAQIRIGIIHLSLLWLSDSAARAASAVK